jgi:hypothetical protein
MYGASMYNELTELREQFTTNDQKLKVMYLSGILSQVQIFAEFFFDILSERCEPVVLIYEALKALLKLKEYSTLIS